MLWQVVARVAHSGQQPTDGIQLSTILWVPALTKESKLMPNDWTKKFRRFRPSMGSTCGVRSLALGLLWQPLILHRMCARAAGAARLFELPKPHLVAPANTARVQAPGAADV